LLTPAHACSRLFTSAAKFNAVFETTLLPGSNSFGLDEIVTTSGLKDRGFLINGGLEIRVRASGRLARMR